MDITGLIKQKYWDIFSNILFCSRLMYDFLYDDNSVLVKMNVYK